VDGEFELIGRVREILARGAGAGGAEVAVGSGDDAAVTVSGGVTATSVDALVEDVHFRRSTFGPRAIGRKALAAALSDLAAMGASPGEAYVQLGIPPDLDEAGCLEIAEGIAAVAGEHGVAVLGGDVTRAEKIVVAVTVVGHLESAADAVTRGGARAGDVLAVTGELGGAAAGLLLLERPELGSAVDARTAEALRRRHLDPAPRLRAGLALAGAGATAMIDVSDGLGADAGHLARASGVAVDFELARLPVQDGVAAVGEAAGVDTWELAAAGGEDYELLAALPPGEMERAATALGDLGVALTVVATARDGAGVRLVSPDGGERAPAGFDQLREDRSSAGPAGRGGSG
jgi:thiamine-monophosphate kinase